MRTRQQRRRFLKAVGGCAVLIPLAGLARTGGAHAEEMPKLEEDDPVAQGFSYVHDATESEHPAYQEGQTCANCMLYEGQEGEQWGPCEIIQGKLVNADGWCHAWTAG